MKTDPFETELRQDKTRQDEDKGREARRGGKTFKKLSIYLNRKKRREETRSLLLLHIATSTTTSTISFQEKERER